MPSAKIIAFPKSKRRKTGTKAKRIGIKAKREAIAKAYGRKPINPIGTGVSAAWRIFTTPRRNLAMAPPTKEHPIKELLYLEEFCDWTKPQGRP
jgi:hypothetical protein